MWIVSMIDRTVFVYIVLAGGTKGKQTTNVFIH